MGGLTIHKAEKQDGGGLVADRHLYLTRESEAGQRIVEKGDAAAGYLFATPGSVIPADQVKAYKLEIKDDKIVQAKNADGSPVVIGSASHDQETGPALKKAADEKRAADMGKTQTEVALTAPAPGAAEGAKRRDAVAAAAAEESTAPAPRPAAPKPAAKKAARKRSR